MISNAPPIPSWYVDAADDTSSVDMCRVLACGMGVVATVAIHLVGGHMLTSCKQQTTLFKNHRKEATCQFWRAVLICPEFSC
jgi:hypothetical protein